MVALMKRDEEKIKDLRRKLFVELSTLNASETSEFIASLIDAMQVWAFELEKARRLRKTMSMFLDANCKYEYEEDESDADNFYSYYF
jgi:DNA-binding PucR family transcriptional regulator